MHACRFSAAVLALLISADLAGAIEAFEAQGIEPVQAETIEPFEAEAIDPFQAELVRPFAAEEITEHQAAPLRPYSADVIEADPPAREPAVFQGGAIRALPPTDWTSGETGKFVVLQAPGQTGVLIALWPAQALPQGFEVWFRELYDVIPDGQEVVRRSPVVDGRGAHGEVTRGFGLTTKTGKGFLYRLFHAIDLGGSARVVQFEAPTPELFRANLPLVNDFIRNLTYLTPPPPPAPGQGPGFDRRLTGSWVAYIPGVFTPNPHGPGGKAGVGALFGVLSIAADGRYIWRKDGRPAVTGKLSAYEPPDRRRGDTSRWYSVTDGDQQMYVAYSADIGELSFASKGSHLWAMGARRAK